MVHFGRVSTAMVTPFDKKGHIDFSVGFKHQDITFIYVQDLVQAVFLTFNRGKNGRKFARRTNKVNFKYR